MFTYDCPLFLTIFANLEKQGYIIIKSTNTGIEIGVSTPKPYLVKTKPIKDKKNKKLYVKYLLAPLFFINIFFISFIQTVTVIINGSIKSQCIKFL